MNDNILRSLFSFMPQIKKNKSVIFQEIRPDGYYYHIAYIITDKDVDGQTNEFLNIAFCTISKLIKRGRVNLQVKETYDKFIDRHRRWNHTRIY